MSGGRQWELWQVVSSSQCTVQATVNQYKPAAAKDPSEVLLCWFPAAVEMKEDKKWARTTVVGAQVGTRCLSLTIWAGIISVQLCLCQPRGWNKVLFFSRVRLISVLLELIRRKEMTCPSAETGQVKPTHLCQIASTLSVPPKTTEL